MTQLTHTPLSNIELCYDGIHTPLTRTLIADLPKDFKGYWHKYTYDAHGNELTFENSSGYWSKYTYDAHGNILTYEDKYGLITYIAGDRQYGLYYRDGLYKAGCRAFSYSQAVVHWSQRAQEDDAVIKARAIKFLAAINKHHAELTK